MRTENLLFFRYATQKAFNMWSEVTPFDFYEISNGSVADIRIGFYHDDHECQWSFAGGEGGIAHAPNIYPNRTENYAMIHFDDKKHWVYLNVGYLEKDPKAKVFADYLETLVHEIGIMGDENILERENFHTYLINTLGHVLGLRHILEDENAIMYPVYKLRTDSKRRYIYPRLTQTDIEAIRKIYGMLSF